jgi:hypothetical protein
MAPVGGLVMAPRKRPHKDFTPAKAKALNDWSGSLAVNDSQLGDGLRTLTVRALRITRAVNTAERTAADLRHSAIQRYAIAAIIAVAAVGVRMAVDPILGRHS